MSQKPFLILVMRLILVKLILPETFIKSARGVSEVSQQEFKNPEQDEVRENLRIENASKQKTNISSNHNLSEHRMLPESDKNLHSKVFGKDISGKTRSENAEINKVILDSSNKELEDAVLKVVDDYDLDKINSENNESSHPTSDTSGTQDLSQVKPIKSEIFKKDKPKNLIKNTPAKSVSENVGDSKAVKSSINKHIEASNHNEDKTIKINEVR